jgi:hypothetical protein
MAKLTWAQCDYLFDVASAGDYGAVFDGGGKSLAKLVELGLVYQDGERWHVTEAGLLWFKNRGE